LESKGEHDKAAAWSIFSGLTDRAIEALSNASESNGNDGRLFSQAIDTYFHGAVFTQNVSSTQIISIK
jgi:CobQ-like glutamine amidotransferase family enzyme